MVNLFQKETKKLIFNKVADIPDGQDGAIYGGYIFRLDHAAKCYILSAIDYSLISTIVLEKSDIMLPHSNAGCFGTSFYQDGDEFPLLYTNLYNNYSNHQDRREGYLCVYRITRENNDFTTQLVQIIKIGFVSDSNYWCSKNAQDVRPYGNFVIDKDEKRLYAYVMRDEEKRTRFFGFDIPKITDGVFDKEFGVNVVSLTVDDIRHQFDSNYVNYMQGGICHNGYIYSVEGFTCPKDFEPGIKIFDIRNEKMVYESNLTKEYDLTIEPEFIEVYDEKVYYGDSKGNLYIISFE